LLYAGYSIGLANKPPISWLSFIFVLAVSALITVLPFSLYEIAVSCGGLLISAPINQQANGLKKSLSI
ncbi:MAG: hypothetical protein ACWIPH_05850, partial [Ostreibacterium sp.]